MRSTTCCDDARQSRQAGLPRGSRHWPDGAYGAEIHKLRQDALDDSGAIFGRTDFASIAKGFGLRGANVSDLGQRDTLMRDHTAHATTEIWNIPISDQVTSPSMRRQTAKGHGVM